MDDRAVRRAQGWAVVLLAFAFVVAALGAVVVGAFHREYGDITRSGYLQGLGPGLAVAFLAAIPAAFAVALARPRYKVGVAAALVVLGAVVGTMAATERGVSAKEAGMPRAPVCAAGDPADEVEAEKAAAVEVFGSAVAPYAEVFAALPSPGHFGEGQVSVDGCGGWLVDVGVVEAYAFYERELPGQGWTITERAPGQRLKATRGAYTFGMGAAVTDGRPLVEVYRTGSR